MTITADEFLDGEDGPAEATKPKADYEGIHPRHMIHLKAISPEVARDTVRSHNGSLIFKVRRPNGTEFTVTRPDNPPVDPETGKVTRKYLHPKNGRGLNVHPLVRQHMTDVTAPLVIGEGTKQYHAIVSALLGKKFFPVGISGIRNWQWKPGGKDTPSVPLPDWGYIPVAGRKVYVVPDGDYAENEDVRTGTDSLMQMMTAMGASSVHRATIPLAEGEKTGADDHLGRLEPAKRQAEMLRLLDEAENSQLPEFFKELSPEVRDGVRNALLNREVLRLANQYEASQRPESSMTVTEAVDAVLSGATVDVPTVALIDGHERGMGLFYPGHVNGIYGDSSVGKSVILAEVQKRVLNEGGIVVHFEFDNNPVLTLVKRLLDAGAKAEHIRHRFHVLYSGAGIQTLPTEAKTAARLVTLDALNPAVVSFGLDPYHPGGVDTVIQECFRPFTLHGACGIFVDHVGHDNKERQAGSIRKAQAVQGALYEAVRDTALKPGTTGRTRLVLRKDNRGSLGTVGRAVAVAVMESGAEPGDLAGEVVTVFQADGGRIKRDPDEVDLSGSRDLPAKNRIWIALNDVYGEQKFTRAEAKALLVKEGMEPKTFLNRWGELIKEGRIVNVPTSSGRGESPHYRRVSFEELRANAQSPQGTS